MAHLETDTRKIVKRLKADGWVQVSGSKHNKFEHSARPDALIIPRHKQQSPGVARSIARAAGWI